MDARRTEGRGGARTAPAGSPPTGPGGLLSGRLKVWIDQDLCTGDGICTDSAPEVFTILEDGIAYCVQDGEVFNDPGGAADLAIVGPASEARVIHAAADCPGECIFIEIEEFTELGA